MGKHYEVRVIVTETTDVPGLRRSCRDLLDVSVQSEDEVKALRKVVSLLEVEELAINSNKPAKTKPARGQAGGGPL